tara:strand:+ start:808 stop:1128 length:321 start_codon:yes stop_codon:yes gene_type:complete
MVCSVKPLDPLLIPLISKGINPGFCFISPKAPCSTAASFNASLGSFGLSFASTIVSTSFFVNVARLLNSSSVNCISIGSSFSNPSCKVTSQSDKSSSLEITFFLLH